MAVSAAIAAPSMFAVLDDGDSAATAGGDWSEVRRKARKVKAKPAPVQALTGKPAATQPFDYYAVVDFECTCERGDSWWLHEIIEFPVVLVNTHTRLVEFEFHSFVRPTERPKLTDFCTELTGITQATVDSAPTLPAVLTQLYAFVKQHKLTFASSPASPRPTAPASPSFSCCWVSDGQADFHHFLHAELLRKRLPAPPAALFSHYCDIRLTFTDYFPHCSRAYLSRMLREVGLRFVGRPHCGLDDARNIARVLTAIVGRGGLVTRNSQLPSH